MNVEIKIRRNERPTPIRKLADAELHFVGGDLAGLKLVGVAVWERRDGTGRNVTFPARPFIVHGDRRNFAPTACRCRQRRRPSTRRDHGARGR
ncbi:MAG: hypothetical protein IT179_01875 [Acidobacteria bacterium]|nr:hypothetical protein [Acidobacteriota bacterium]